MPGILCINIDDLRPPNSLIAASTQDKAVQAISLQNMQFLGRQRAHIPLLHGAARIIGYWRPAARLSKCQIPYQLLRDNRTDGSVLAAADLRDLMTTFVQRLERVAVSKSGSAVGRACQVSCTRIEAD